jgi:hypothetical protein
MRKRLHSNVLRKKSQATNESELPLLYACNCMHHWTIIQFFDMINVFLPVVGGDALFTAKVVGATVGCVVTCTVVILVVIIYLHR